MRILVLTTTGQPEANLESARHFIQNKSQIDKIAIISSQQMLKDGKTALLQSSLKDICLADTEIIELPQGYEESNMIGIQELIVAWAHAHPAKARFIFNVTGGTKLISLALDRASQLRYAQILIDVMRNDFNKGRRFCSFINKLASISDEQDDLSIRFEAMEPEQAEGLEILAQITQQAFFSFDRAQHQICFNSKEARDYMKGGWLEVYSGYECYKALIGLSPNAELSIHVELKKNDMPNEMDVMFIHQAHLYCIECKTAKTMAHEQAKDVLYKLSSLQDFGGINQKQAVVSLYSLKDYNLARAHNSEIRIFQERDVLNLSELITDWLQPDRMLSNNISL